MTTFVLIGVGVVMVVVYLFTICLCIVASRADERLRAIYRDEER